MNNDEELRKFNEEHNRVYTSAALPNLNMQNQQKPPTEDQVVLAEVQAQVNAKTTNTPSQLAPEVVPNSNPIHTQHVINTSQDAIGGVCNECDVIHPPLRTGEKCPNAKLNLPTITDDEIGYFLSNIKNIIVSQIEKNQIKNVKKLFQQSIIILAKFLEEYTEGEKNESNESSVRDRTKATSTHHP